MFWTLVALAWIVETMTACNAGTLLSGPKAVPSLQGSCLREETSKTSCCPCGGTPVYRCAERCPLGYFTTETTVESCEAKSASSPTNTTEEEEKTGRQTWVSCLKCDAACDGCRGPGPEDCLNCTEGYQASDTTGESEGTTKCSVVARYTTESLDIWLPVFLGILAVGIVAFVILACCLKHYRKCCYSPSTLSNKHDGFSGRTQGTTGCSTSIVDLPEVGQHVKLPNEVNSPAENLQSDTGFTNGDEPTPAGAAADTSDTPACGQATAASTSSYGAAFTTNRPEDPAARFHNRENKITTHFKPDYIGSVRPYDADSVRSSRPASVRSGSSGYISGAGDSVRSTPSLRARHGHGDLARQAMESLIGLPANTHSLMDSSSTQTVAGADSIPPRWSTDAGSSLRRSRTMEGAFKKERSAVRLEVPTGAIQRGDFVNIYQAVSVDLHRAAETLPIPEDEVIVSPVAEFYAGDGFRFRKPVCIVLPHLLPAGCTQHDLRVYHFCEDESEKPQLRELQYRGSDCPQTTVGTAGTYCFGEGSTVHIFVDHFSAVLCTKCKSQCFLPDLWLELFGHYTQLSESEWEVGLLLKIWDTEIVDFRQDDPDKDSVHFNQMKKIDGKTLPAVALSGDGDTMKALESTGISVKLALPCRQRQQWTHKTRDDGPHGEIHVHPPEQIFRLKQFALCDKHRSKWCQRKDWSLTNGPNVTPDRAFSAYVDVCYVTMVRTPTSDSRELSGDSDKITFEVRILHDGGGTNDSRLTQSGEGATGGNTNTHTTGVGDPGSGHWSHQTLLKVAERDPDETCRLQAEAVQRSGMAFQNVGNLNILLPGASHPGIEQRGVIRTPGTISPPTPISPPWADAAGQSAVSSPGTAEERTAQNTNNGLDSLSAHTAETVGQRTLSGQPYMADSRSLSFPSMNSENDTDV